jgi:hypothetical protein
MLGSRRATDMLEITIIGLLVCICLLELIALQVLRRKLHDARKERDSWKLAAEHWEKEANGW